MEYLLFRAGGGGFMGFSRIDTLLYLGGLSGHLPSLILIQKGQDFFEQEQLGSDRPWVGGGQETL